MTCGTPNVGLFACMAALGCAPDLGNPSEDCGGIDWSGHVESKARTLLIEGCVNDECFRHELDVTSDVDCRQRVAADGSHGSEACATRGSDGLDIEVFLAAASSNTSRTGLSASLKVTDAETRDQLVHLTRNVELPGAAECRTFFIEFTGEATRDGGVPLDSGLVDGGLEREAP